MLLAQEANKLRLKQSSEVYLAYHPSPFDACEAGVHGIMPSRKPEITHLSVLLLLLSVLLLLLLLLFCVSVYWILVQVLVKPQAT